MSDRFSLQPNCEVKTNQKKMGEKNKNKVKR